MTPTWEIRKEDAIRGLRALPEDVAGAIVTDPPYSSGGLYRGDRARPTSEKYVLGTSLAYRPEFAGDSRDQLSYLWWSWMWMAEGLRVVHPGGSLLVFSDWRQLATTITAVQAAGWVYRGIVVWDKTLASRPQAGRFRAQAEYVVWGTRGDAPTSGECLLGVVTCSSLGPDREHIAEKPAEVLDVLVSVSPADGLVIDPFCGSGTTGVSCLRLGRSFLGFEIDPLWAEKARERLEKAEVGLGRNDRKQMPMFSTPGEAP